MKRFIFKYYLVILFASLIGIDVWFYFSPQAREDIIIVVTVFGGVFSLFYFVQQQQIEELKFFKELFSDFNNRYEDLNDKLDKIIECEHDDMLTDEERATLNDYFNLCSEEYFYYNKGYIYPEVWKAWCIGMLHYFENEQIKSLWRADEANGKPNSYYGLDLDKIERGSKLG